MPNNDYELSQDSRHDPKDEYANDGTCESGGPPKQRGPLLMGSFWKDLTDPAYNKQWPNLATFEEWKTRVSRMQHFDWIRSAGNHHGKRFKESMHYVCSSGASGGERVYEKKFPDRDRKVPTRKTLCDASLIAKTYQDTEVVLGKYYGHHNHATDPKNLPFVGISSSTRRGLHAMAQEGRTPNQLVKAAREGVFSGFAPSEEIILREQAMRLRDARYYTKKAEEAVYRFSANDSTSVLQWIKKLTADDALLAYKPCNGLPDHISMYSQNLRPDVFLLILQWPWQRKTWNQLGGHYAGVDGTHNITKYKNMILHTIMARDEHGHGVPVCHMFASNGEENTFLYYFDVFKQRNPVEPTYILTDRDLAQINALRIIFPNSTILLCKWHVIHDWHGHLDIKNHSDGWDALKKLPDTHSIAEHEAKLAKIQELVTPAFMSYLHEHWLQEPWLSMWAGYARLGRSILEHQDTNMIIESYHNFLKTTVFCRKVTRRLDFVLWKLSTDVADHYQTKSLRQSLGFEGMNLENEERRNAERLGSKIRPECIRVVALEGGEELLEEAALYQVQSQTTPSAWYDVDLDRPFCSCRAFPKIKWCKHLAAARLLENLYEGLEWKDVERGQTAESPDLPAMRKEDEDEGEGNDAAMRDKTPTVQPTEPAPVTNNKLNSHAKEYKAAYIMNQIRQLASSNSSLVDTPEHILDEAQRVMHSLIQHAHRPLPPSTQFPPNLLHTTTNVLPASKNTKKSRRVNTDPYSAGEKAGKHATKEKFPELDSPGSQQSQQSSRPNPTAPSGCRPRKQATTSRNGVNIQSVTSSSLRNDQIRTITTSVSFPSDLRQAPLPRVHPTSLSGPPVYSQPIHSTSNTSFMSSYYNPTFSTSSGSLASANAPSLSMGSTSSVYSHSSSQLSLLSTSSEVLQYSHSTDGMIGYMPYTEYHCSTSQDQDHGTHVLQQPTGWTIPTCSNRVDTANQFSLLDDPELYSRLSP